MNENTYSQWKKRVAVLADDELLIQVRRNTEQEREKTAWFVAHLAEVIRRELALKRGYGSPFQYARRELGFTDSQAGDRIDTARLALQLPETIERIARGELTLAAAGVLYRGIREVEKPVPLVAAKHGIEPAQTGFALGPGTARSNADAASETKPAASQRSPVSAEEKKELFAQVLGKSRLESVSILEEWKGARDPEAELLSRARPKGSRKPARGGWTELNFYLNDAELAEWDRLRDLLSHTLRSRDPQAVFAWMLAQSLERVDPVRKQDRADRRAERREQKERDNATVRDEDGPLQQAPGSPFRRKPIPEALKRKIWIRDGGKCQFTDPKTGNLCGSTAYCDFDHRWEVCRGGENTEENLILACGNHNRRRHRWRVEEQPAYAVRTE